MKLTVSTFVNECAFVYMDAIDGAKLMARESPLVDCSLVGVS